MSSVITILDALSAELGESRVLDSVEQWLKNKLIRDKEVYPPCWTPPIINMKQLKIPRVIRFPPSKLEELYNEEK